MAIRPAARRSPGRAPRAKKPGARQSGLVSGAAGGGQAGSGARIPAAQAGFLGRAGEIAELSRLLEGERLVTLTGAPGIGKTRLAVELASVIRDGFAGGARVAELASVSRPAHVARAVASALSIDEQPGQDLTETIVARLARRRVLLVLDNCEHVLGGCAKLVGALLSGCPKLSVLATSREALGVPNERVWEVPPLALPDPAAGAQPEKLVQTASVGLFVERAAAVQPDFSLNAYVAPAVVEIVRRLDGIPLAIELAAGRVASLTVAEIAGRLSDRFALLSKGIDVEPARHQTLGAALDWSYELLTAPERALLGRLSVFAGAFDVKAVEAVCAGGEIEVGQIGDLLGGLVGKSLVAEADALPTVRYRLLETIRVYAAERLEQAGELAELRSAHARFYLELSEQAEPELTGPDQQDWFGRLESERSNLRSAIEWSLSHGDIEQALRLAGALVLFWRVRCHFSEGRELLDAAVAVSDNAPVGMRAKALWGAGFMAHMMGDNDAAIASLEPSLTLFRQLDDLQGSARALMVLGNCMLYRADRSSGLSRLEQSASEARVARDAWCLGHALALQGFDYLSVDELPRARALFEECLEMARAAGEGQTLRFGLFGLGAVALGQGDFDLAESLLEEALTVTDQLGEDYARAWSLHYLGELATARGDYARAHTLLDDAIATASSIGAGGIEANSLLALGRAVRAQGDPRGARRLFEQARARITPDTSEQVLVELGDLEMNAGERETARHLFEEALRRARARGQKQFTGRTLLCLANLARDEGDRRRAAVLQGEALELAREMESTTAIVDSLEAIAAVIADDGRHEQAARLLGAAHASRSQNGYVRPPWDASRCAADAARLRKQLSEQAFDRALASGARLSLQQAADEASRDEETHGRPASGWSSLTERERQVAALAAEGLTNPEIAARLLISRATVKLHLSRAYQKLGVAGRTELARETSANGLKRNGDEGRGPHTSN